jgi:hypothetical protein
MAYQATGLSSTERKDITMQPVTIYLFNDKTIHGYIHLKQNQRVSDLLNDDRVFIPIIQCLHSKNSIIVVNKNNIAHVEEK